MAKKTKFVRIATSGKTIDGRTIDPVMLTQAAQNFNPETYPCRINLEHFRGITGDKPFGMYGDVLSLKTEEVTLDVAGKPEKRVGLYAELQVSDDLVALNKNGQKLYTSIELEPNFAGSNKAYCLGLAVTDSPAALGTERLDLQFTARAKAYGTLVSEPNELSLDLVPEPAKPETENVIAGLKSFFSSFAPQKPEPVVAPVVTPAASSVPTDFAAFSANVGEGFNKLASAMEVIAASQKTTNDAMAKVTADLAAVTADFKAFKGEVEAAPGQNYKARPLSTGGDGAILADC